MSIDIRSRIVQCGKPRMSILSSKEESTRPIPHCFLGTKKDPINIESGGKDGGEDRREVETCLTTLDHGQSDKNDITAKKDDV